MTYYNSEIKRKNKYSRNEKKLYKKILRNELKQKIVVINCTEKGAYILIFNGLQLRNKKKKINIVEKKKKIKNYSEMSIDAFIEENQLKFITNFNQNLYEFRLIFLYKGIYFHFQRSSIWQRGRGL